MSSSCLAVALPEGPRDDSLADAVRVLRARTEVLRLRTIARQRRAATTEPGAPPADPGAPLDRDAVWHFADDGRWFEPPGAGRVDLARRAQLARLIATLLRRRAERLDAVVTVPELVAAMWPGERLLPKSAATRIYTTVRYLRNLGLDILATGEGGYLLDPRARVVAGRGR